MKYFVVEPLTLETSQGKVTLPAGKILELSQDQAARLAGKIEIIPPLNEGRDLPCYCISGDCWCSATLSDSDYPKECIRIKCEHYQPSSQAA